MKGLRDLQARADRRNHWEDEFARSVTLRCTEFRRQPSMENYRQLAYSVRDLLRTMGHVSRGTRSTRSRLTWITPAP